jgi:hypothetical protein
VLHGQECAFFVFDRDGTYICSLHVAANQYDRDLLFLDCREELSPQEKGIRDTNDPLDPASHEFLKILSKLHTAIVDIE